jgi:alpha-D-ribose 1-methylphosphonate 5-phosphate C-P lyase
MMATDSQHSGCAYEFGFLDEYAKREIRRCTLKAIAIPGYQVPYSSREMPMARGFGTGGLQLTLSLVGPQDTIKVIDQGSDASVNAVNIRRFIGEMCPGVELTTRTPEASIIQTRHRIPEVPMRADQILVLQVPYPDPLVVVEPSEAKRKTMHGEADYAKLWVKLYEDVVTFSEVSISHRYPTRIHGHYVIDPSPIPRFDVPRLHQAQTLYLFGAGREKKIYAVPPYTDAEPLVFDDIGFRVEEFNDPMTGRRIQCDRCGADNTFLDEVLADDGQTLYCCSDTDYCDTRVAQE